MDEYIKREEAIKIAESYGPQHGSSFCRNRGIADYIAEDISMIPSADVAPVRHGRWIEPLRLHYGAKQYECSLCYSDTFWRKHSIPVKYPYCPNCGCRMDGGAD